MKVEELRYLVDPIFNDVNSIVKSLWIKEINNIMLSYKKRVQNRRKKDRKKGKDINIDF
jgi:hypothetical protein